MKFAELSFTSITVALFASCTSTDHNSESEIECQKCWQAAVHETAACFPDKPMMGKLSSDGNSCSFEDPRYSITLHREGGSSYGLALFVDGAECAKFGSVAGPDWMYELTTASGKVSATSNRFPSTVYCPNGHIDRGTHAKNGAEGICTGNPVHAGKHDFIDSDYDGKNRTVAAWFNLFNEDDTEIPIFRCERIIP